MKQLTIRGLTTSWQRTLRIWRAGRVFPLCRAVMRLLRRGADLDHGKADIVGTSLDHLTGTWSSEEADRIDRALEDFSRIDEAMWK